MFLVHVFDRTFVNNEGIRFGHYIRALHELEDIVIIKFEFGARSCCYEFKV